MNEEKRAGSEAGRAPKENADDKRNNAASRARNRTVMLTPEMTGQVRALLYQEPEEEAPAKRDPLTELLPPMDWSRPDTAPAAGAQAEHDDYNRDFAAADETPRGGSTGKLDTSLVQEAVAAPVPPEPRRATSPQISVNPAARPAAPAAAPRRAPDPRARAAAPAPTSRIVGFFVSFDKNPHGETFEIRAGRWLITSRPTDHGEFILIEDETISPLHAIVRATKDGKIQVLDQLSEFGTGVLREGESEEMEVSGTMVNVEHGDVLRLGERRFVVCAIPAVKLEQKAASED